MLYLPRLFVYHCEAAPGSVQSETFKVMERRLLRAIINPAMVASLGARPVARLERQLVLSAPGCTASWCCVLVMSGVHGMLARWTKDFAADRNRHTQKFFRIMNEVPTVLMIGIVILVVLKPF